MVGEFLLESTIYFKTAARLFTKGPSIKDVSPKGEGGGYPQKEMLGDGREGPCLKQRRRLF